MNTVIDNIISPLSTVSNMQKAASMVEVIRTGLFGVYHYKVMDLEFEQINVTSRGRTISHYWIMVKNGKSYRIKYSYVVYLTFKRLGFIDKG